MPNTPADSELAQIANELKHKALQLGFQDCAITLPDARSEAEHLRDWLGKGYQGEMTYLENHFDKRINPALLVEGTERIVLLRMDYLPPDTRLKAVLQDRRKAYIARYTLGRDYHKLIRSRLKKLGAWLEQRYSGRVQFRPFVDSAPVMERPLARQAGLGWIGKNTLLLNRNAGSWFFLGSLFTDLPLPIDLPEQTSHCGSCQACLDICPTQAFPAPWVLDARRCISYLTIEYSGVIPEALRPAMGNRVFGCDDCQLICPWNRFAKYSNEDDFKPRHNLDQRDLIELFSWDETTFLQRTEGSAIRRTGYQGWLRNLAVALGNSADTSALPVLQARLEHCSEMVAEHIHWAIKRLNAGTAPEPLPILEDPRSDRLSR